jgi:hypothetical protein
MDSDRACQVCVLWLAGDDKPLTLTVVGSADTVTLAERYTAIMNSYAFTTNLVNKYHLEHNIVGVRSKNAPTVTKWSVHTMIADRFNTEYDYKSGNLTLSFLDPSPVEAQRVLGFYLDSLRDKLRNEEVEAGVSAASSLEEEVRSTLAGSVAARRAAFERRARALRADSGRPGRPELDSARIIRKERDANG